jgi:hypothetical protein
MKLRSDLRDEWKKLTGQDALFSEPPPSRYNIVYCMWLELRVLELELMLESRPMIIEVDNETPNSTQDNNVK